MSEFSEEEMRRALTNATAGDLEKMKRSSLVIAQAQNDPLVLLQIGAAIMLDKPLILVTLREGDIPPRARAVADAVVDLRGLTQEQAQVQLTTAIEAVYKKYGM